MSEAYKIFGRKAERGVERLKKGETRQDLLKDGLTAAVINASFEVNAGEIFVVMGLSGSGKSTLIRMLNGLWDPTAGVVEISHQNIVGLNSKALRETRRKRVSMVFQHFALLPHRTVGQNAAYALEISGVNKSEREKRANDALAMVGLDGWGGHLPGELSGGMRQRVGLARALAAETDVMLMDEAFSALDPLIRREMQDQLIDLQQQLGKTIIFITHDLNEAMRMGDRVAMMRGGEIVQLGTSEEILNNPVNDYVAQFVQDVDRTQVLNAGHIMEPPVAVLGSELGPRVAHKLMRENQVNMLAVVDRARKLRGVVHEIDIAQAINRGDDELFTILRPADTVSAETPLADLTIPESGINQGLFVLDDAGVLLGVIATVTLLNAFAGRYEASAADLDEVAKPEFEDANTPEFKGGAS